jgi:hypothetical protein
MNESLFLTCSGYLPMSSLNNVVWGETTSMLNLQGEVLVVSSFTTCLGCGGCDYAVLM